MNKRLKYKILLLGSLGFLASAAEADTLREALAKAYTTNPTLTGARRAARQ